MFCILYLFCILYFLSCAGGDLFTRVQPGLRGLGAAPQKSTLPPMRRGKWWVLREPEGRLCDNLQRFCSDKLYFGGALLSTLPQACHHYHQEENVKYWGEPVRLGGCDNLHRFCSLTSAHPASSFKPCHQYEMEENGKYWYFPWSLRRHTSP